LRTGRLTEKDGSELPADAAADEAARYRMKYVRAVLELSMSKAALVPKIREVWESLSEPKPAKPPGHVSVYRWVRAYRHSGDNAKALIASRSTQGNRAPRFQIEVLDVCNDLIENKYLTLERPTVTDVTLLCRAKLRRLNATRTEGELLRPPTERMLKRLIAELPKFDVHRARFGRDAALKKFRNSSKVRIASSILEHGEIDHTRLDVFAVDSETGAPLGRPWLTVIVDVHSRYILGIAISFEPPSRATVAQCLRHAFLPKTGLRTKFPGISNEWEGYGVFAAITVDGGAEFHSEELERIYFELDIEAVFAPRKTPWFKGKIERLQGTLNRGISAMTPGKTFAGIVDKDEYDPTKHAVVTVEELEFVVHKWIVDFYHQKPHRALGCSPAHAWRLSHKTTEIPLIPDPLRFDAIVAGSDTRMLTHKGIEYSSLLYNCDEIGDLRRTYGDRFEVEIRFNRSNLGSLIVLHPERKTPIRVPCLNPEYAEGLTEWQHKVCKRYARDQMKGDDSEAFLEALLEINEIVSSDLKTKKPKGTTREHIARWTTGKPHAVEPPAPKEPKPSTESATATVAAVALPPPQPASKPVAVVEPPDDDEQDAPIKRFNVQVVNRTSVNVFGADGAEEK
jgi:putative transposase